MVPHNRGRESGREIGTYDKSVAHPPPCHSLYESCTPTGRVCICRPNIWTDRPGTVRRKLLCSPLSFLWTQEETGILETSRVEARERQEFERRAVRPTFNVQKNSITYFLFHFMKRARVWRYIRHFHLFQQRTVTWPPWIINRAQNRIEFTGVKWLENW